MLKKYASLVFMLGAMTMFVGAGWFFSESKTGTLPQGVVLQYTGKVVAITDGDTLQIETQNLDRLIRHRVRLSGVDSPEGLQAYGRAATERMIVLAHDRTCTAYVIGKSYERDVAKVDCDGTDLGLMMIQEGLAWAAPKYLAGDSARREQYEAAQARARAGKAGLWRDLDPTPPWEFRKTKRK